MELKIKTYHIITYGCQMNKNDGEKIAALLEQCGWVEVADEDAANLIILNTCSVRDKAERRVLGKLGEYKHRKESEPELMVAVCGCMPQYKKDELARNKVINLIFGTNTIHRLPELLKQVKPGKCLTDISANVEQTEIAIAPKRSSLHQAWVPISFGCNNFCTYCIVPYTRGREVSRKKEDILEEIRKLDKSQYAQVCLLGQNVNSYGQDIYAGYDFADLLSEVSAIPGVTLIDFMTSHPKDISVKLIDTVHDHANINKALHFALQSGDNDVLKAMNRHYTVEHFTGIINMIRKKIPQAEISTDIIVGFPGETLEQFNNTLKVLRQIKFSRIITTAFSPRAGTPAAIMPGQLSAHEKAQRLQTIMREIDNISAAG